MASSSRVGNEYSDVHIGGGSNHLGNVYNNYGQSKDDRALQAILKSLSYPDMTDRRDTLAEAEEGTFDWTFLEGETKFLKSREVYGRDQEVYDHHSSVNMSFKTWLEGEDEGLFCVMGKPGSGKSTFMKSLAASEEMEIILRAWAADKALIRAEHYFWILGAHMQKTLEGLLRALLHSALLCLSRSEDPEVRRSIEHICERQWRSSDERRAWSCRELKNMLSRLASASNAKIFFLVDALDEYEPQDRVGDLADEILWISQLPNVKLCISCRPWAAFTGRFGKTMILHLHDLTYRDMAVYIEKRLVSAEAENDLETDFRSGCRAAKKLIYETADAAEGVFLWTELVAKALCSEIRKGSSMKKLAQIVTNCPADLDDYFEKLIFDRIGRSRQNVSDTAAALKLALVTSSHDGIGMTPLRNDYLNFWLLSQQRLGVGFSWTDHEDRWYAPHHVERMVRQTRAYLEETCKDLLVLVKDRSGSNVFFLHRTVYDFLCDNRANLTLEQHAPSHFSEEDFVTDLAQLSCIYRLREELQGCWQWRRLLTQILQWYWATNLSGTSTSWILTCQDLVLMQWRTNCDCSGLSHMGTELFRLCAAAGLDKSLIEATTLMPVDAIIVSHMEHNYLGTLLRLSIVMDSRCLNMRLLRRVLQCGCDPNDSSGSQPHKEAQALRYGDVEHVEVADLATGMIDRLYPRNCELTCWEAWLSEAYLQLQCPTVRVVARTGIVEKAGHRRRHMYGDIVQVLLRNGADPCAMACVTDHSTDNLSCSRLPLNKILEFIVPAECLPRLRLLSITCSDDVKRCGTRRFQRKRAIRSLLTSKHNFLSSLGKAELSPKDEVRHRSRWQEHQDTFLKSMIGLCAFSYPSCQLCSNRSKVDSLIAWCIDCSRVEYLCLYCAICSRKDGPDLPTLEHPCKTLSNIHTRPVRQHMTITVLWEKHFHTEKAKCKGNRDICARDRTYGIQAPISDDPQFGAEQAVSVLKEWYAKDPIEPGDLLGDDLEEDLEGAVTSLQELSLT